MQTALFFVLILTNILNLVFAENSAKTKLIFLQILFRHGDRAPVFIYPNDPNPLESWPEGLGKLTTLGKKQHYNLGKYLRSMYKDFITSNPNEVVAVSSAKDRCIRSAQANLASFYEPDSKWAVDEHLKWQPIPVFYLPINTDKYLYPESYCPMASKEQNIVAFSTEVQKINAKHKEMYRNLTILTGSNIADFTAAFYLYDTLFVEQRHNLTIPEYIEPYWEALEEISDEFFYWIYNSPLLHRLRAGPLLQRLIQTMLKKMAGFLPEQKVQIYSTHDATISTVLSALRLYNGKRPPYCATLIFELHEGFNNRKLIRFLYLNSTTPETGDHETHVLKLDGCSEFCPLEYFLNYTRDKIPENWELECSISEAYLEKYIEISNAFSIMDYRIIILILTVSLFPVVFILWKRMFKKNKRYTGSLTLY